MTRVVVVASVRLYREGIAAALGRLDDIDVVGTATDHDGAVEIAAAHAADVLLLDVGAREGRRTVASLAVASPGTAVVALAVGGGEVDVLAWAEAGVAGYVTSDATLDELVAAVRAAAAGELVCSPQIAGALLRRVRALAVASAADGELSLTAREREIAGLLEQGLSNKQIAQKLHIELTTVKNHVHRILGKLGATRRGEAAAAIRRNRISA